MRRIHLLAFPSTQTTAAYSLCGFTSATIRFAKVLKLLGYHVTLYASEENDAPCDELVTVITKEEQQTLLNKVEYQTAPMIQACYPLWALANGRIIREIGKRKQSHDLICTIGGAAHQQIAEAHQDLMTVEYSIGYCSSFSIYRVYESHTWRHVTHGFQVQKEFNVEGGGDGRFFDAVIPLFFDKADFTVRTKKEPFILYVGRLTYKKGLNIACEAAQIAGVPLKVIGHGDRGLVTHGAEYLGALPDPERNEWMSRASALICPTLYIEPFGSVAVEAQMCGTPVISTDFGGFVETIEQGETGFRCNYLGEFVRAIKFAGNLDHRYIAERARRLYSLEAVAPQYQAYFDRLSLRWGDGWSALDVTPVTSRMTPALV